MKIHVTAEDIKKGVPEICDMCPIALALNRVGFQRANVYPTVVEFGRFLEREVDMPTRAIRFIKRFDPGKPVKPFAFLLAAVPDSEAVTP